MGKTQKTSNKLFSSLMIAAASISLAACQPAHKSNNQSDRIDAALERVATEASSQGYTRESLNALEKLYKRDSENMDVAYRYARALRENGRLNRASLVLEPFATDEDTEDHTLITEFAAIQATMGNYLNAEQYARRAVLLNPESAKAYHILGISLDAQGNHEQAETAFRKGLEYWEGSPSPVLNNLGLNLASQGFIDDALDTLRRAAALSPERDEIERNIRIVSALQTAPPTEGWRMVPPKPRKKPVIN